MKTKLLIIIIALGMFVAGIISVKATTTTTVINGIEDTVNSMLIYSYEILGQLSSINENLARMLNIQQESMVRFADCDVPGSQNLRRVFSELPEGSSLHDFESIKGNIDGQNADVDGVYEVIFGVPGTDLTDDIIETDITAKQGIYESRIAKVISDSLLQLSYELDNLNQCADSQTKLIQVANLTNAKILQAQLLQLRMDSQELKTDAVMLANQNKSMKTTLKQQQDFFKSLSE